MAESAHAPTAAEAGSHSPAPASYRNYWVAWLVLLGLTVMMVQIHDRRLLLTGIGIKSFIIGAWFMHLKHESRILKVSVLIGFGFAVFLFFLIQFDRHAALAQ